MQVLTSWMLLMQRPRRRQRKILDDDFLFLLLLSKGRQGEGGGWNTHKKDPSITTWMHVVSFVCLLDFF